MRHGLKTTATITIQNAAESATFAVVTAAFAVLPDENDLKISEIFFYVRGARAEFPCDANAEVSVFAKDFVLENAVAQRFHVPRSWSDERDDDVSALYFYEHHDFNDIVVKIMARDGDFLHVLWTGTTNNDNGAITNRVAIDAVFQRCDSREEARIFTRVEDEN